jgi:hypothetical protein
VYIAELPAGEKVLLRAAIWQEENHLSRDRRFRNGGRE